MNKLHLTFLALLLCATLHAQNKTIAERLGYPKDAKLLIIHADDIGVSHAENAATIDVMEKGVVNSGSIMVPCPWFPEIAVYAKAHPQADLGLHLTLTAEWKIYKWGPVQHDAKSLVTADGFLNESVEAFMKKATLADVARELRAQVLRAKQFGIDPTHFDTHMGSLLASADMIKAYMALGREFKVPVLLNREIAKAWAGVDLGPLLTPNDVVTDKIFMASPPDFAGGMKNFYTNTLRTLQPGLNVILLHAAYDNPEMQAVTVDHPDYGAAWRQADFDFFSSDDARTLLKENNIQVVTWREVRDKIVRAK